MELIDFLLKFSDNVNLKAFFDKALHTPSNYVDVTKLSNEYIITPKERMYLELGSQNLSLRLDCNLDIIESKCGCLHFYKNKECIHIVAMYALGLKIIDNEKFEKEYYEYNRKINCEKNKNTLLNLANTLKNNNPYFNMIHLVPIIEEINSEFFLSVKIGFDKDYVIKDIPLFVRLTENNEEYTYGQKLTFIHSYECFDKVSKEFYLFLANVCNDSIKKIKMKKSNLLKVLEYYKDQYIYLKLENEASASARKIESTDNVKIILNNIKLYFDAPNYSRPFINGVNSAYFISNDTIYTYTYKSRSEEKIFNSLFKSFGELSIVDNSDNFIINLLPLIRNQIEVADEFYDKYPIPDVKINSYLSYLNGEIILNCKIRCNEVDKKSPYIKEMLTGYFKIVESYKFKRIEKVYKIKNLDEQYYFLTGDLSSLKSFGEVYFDDSIKNVKARKTSKTRVSISYNVGLLDFNFKNSDFTIEELQQMLKAYHEKKKFIRLKDDSILELDDQNMKEIDDFLEDFNISIKDLNKKNKKPLNYLLKLINGVDNNLDVDDKVYDLINELQNFKKSDKEPSNDLKNILRSYQLEGFKWLSSLAKYNFGGILADDMGLGKTLQIISFIKADSKKKPSLIACPMSLVYNWENECGKWNIDCPVTVVLGSIDERESIINSINSKEKHLYITSYDSLRRDIELYKAQFRFIVADEAQFIKNQFALKSEAIKSLNSEANFALTGTPIENGLSDLWSIFDFIMPGYLADYNHFKSRYESLIINKDDEALQKLQMRVKPFILRRTKKDVLKDLPDKIEECYYIKMGNKQRDIYDGYITKLKDDIKNNSGKNVLGLLTRLRQICITPELVYQENFENTKIDMAVDLIKSSIDANHRILVFSQFAQVFPIISKQLELMNIRHFILDGSTKPEKRIEMVEEYNKNEDIKVFLISLKAGGTGLNLVGADMVIHLDPWWNSSREAQATDRAYRIGQTKDVYVAKIICKDTIEEKVVDLQKIKSQLADSIVSFESGKFTKQDILDLIE